MYNFFVYELAEQYIFDIHNFVCYMGVKLGLPYQEKNVDWGCLRKRSWEIYMRLNGREWRKMHREELHDKHRKGVKPCDCVKKI
jgi:hypothetical protein